VSIAQPFAHFAHPSTPTHSVPPTLKSDGAAQC
jgi:hypothetical protein